MAKPKKKVLPSRGASSCKDSKKQPQSGQQKDSCSNKKNSPKNIASMKRKQKNMSDSDNVRSSKRLKTAVSAAAKTNDLALVKRLVEKGANINDNQLSISLEYAVYNNNIDMMEYLIEKGAIINDNQLFNALEYAVYKNNIDMVEYLIEKGARIEGAFEKSDSTCNNTDTESVLDKKNSRSKHSVLITAVKRGNIGIVRYLLDKGANVNFEDQFLSTPLFEAARKDDGKIIRLLAEKGAKFVLKSKSFLKSPSLLIEACEFDNYEGFCSLLKIGCNVNEAVETVCDSSSILEYLMCMDFPGRRCKSEFIITTFQYGGKIFAEQAFSLVHRSVVPKEVDMLKALLSSGDFGPTILKTNSKFCKLPYPGEWWNRGDYYSTAEVDHKIGLRVLEEFEGLMSPLCIALICGFNVIAQDFINMNYLTSSDLYKLPKSLKLRMKLTEEENFSCIELLDNMEQSVPSLFQLAFVYVSDSLSSKLDRHENVTKLGLPPPLTKALLFQGKDQILTETNCESKDDVTDGWFVRDSTDQRSIFEWNYRVLFDYFCDSDSGSSDYDCSDYDNSSVSDSYYDSDNV